MTTYKLTYFPWKGRGNVIRMQFTLAGVSFEDHTVTHKEWFESEKKKQIFEHIPVLEVSENSKTHVLACSTGINRFLANRFGFYGKDEFERAKIDMILDQSEDILVTLVKSFKIPGIDENAKMELFEKEATGPAAHMLKLIQNILEQNNNGTGFIVGDSLTVADLYVVNIFDWFRHKREEVLANLNLLRHFEQRMKNYPILDQYLRDTESQKVNPFFPPK